MNPFPTLLLMYECLSPRAGGAPIILDRLLRAYPGELSIVTARFYWDRKDGLLPLGKRPRFAPWMGPRGPISRRFSPYFNLGSVGLIARVGEQVVAERQAHVLLASPFGGGEFFLAAHLVSRATGIPLLAYVMDDWTAGATHHTRLHGLLAHSMMPRILRSAAHVWTVSDAMSADLSARYSIKCETLMPAVEIEQYEAARAGLSPEAQQGGPIEVTYAGAVYGAQADAIRNLMHLFDETEGLIAGHRFRFTIYTHAGQRSLNRGGLHRPWMVFREADLDEMPSILARTHVAFLPYSFDERFRQIVSTSFPTKATDYLASGLPVLVHAPPWASITQHACTHGFGVVVDHPSRRALAEALTSLAEPTLRARLGERARATARCCHDLAAARARMYAVFAAGREQMLS